METEERIGIVGAEVLDGRLVVSFSDNTAATFSVKDLLAIATDRIDSGMDKAGG